MVAQGLLVVENCMGNTSKAGCRRAGDEAHSNGNIGTSHGLEVIMAVAHDNDPVSRSLVSVNDVLFAQDGLDPNHPIIHDTSS